MAFGVIALLAISSIMWTSFSSSAAAVSPHLHTIQVLNKFPQDPKAFTQSSVRRVSLRSGKVEALQKMDGFYFGEGLTLLGKSPPRGEDEDIIQEEDIGQDGRGGGRSGGGTIDEESSQDEGNGDGRVGGRRGGRLGGDDNYEGLHDGPDENGRQEDTDEDSAQFQDIPSSVQSNPPEDNHDLVIHLSPPHDEDQDIIQIEDNSEDENGSQNGTACNCPCHSCTCCDG